MTTALVSLPQLEIKWSHPEQPLLVGKDILELLSTSMYVDPMSMYREYIQNAADAIDVAQAAGLLHGPGRVEIRLDPAIRTVFIRDNGSGLGKEQFVHQLTALGGSKKRGTKARGFRGVGRLAGLAFCQELIFRSRQAGEPTIHELRWDSREVRSLLRSTDNSSDLREIVSKTIQTRDIPGRLWPDHFFEVELRGIIRHRDDRLLNEEQVANYIAQVAPVSFPAEFQFADQIRSFLETYGIRLGAIQLEIAGRGSICRPHKNGLAMGKAGETQFRELTTFFTPGRDGDVAAATWILHHDYRGSLPSNCLVEGWRLRSGDIQVGDNNLLQALFPESRFNSWCVAETHILDPRILPNGRRDHFEQSTFYFDLINHLAPHARDIAQRCRTSSISRNLIRSINECFTECQQNLRVIEHGVIAATATSKLTAQLKTGLDRLQRLCSRASLAADQQLQYQARVKQLQKRMLRVSTEQEDAAILASLTSEQRTILTEVFNTIYESTNDLQQAQIIIDKIARRLKRRNARMKKRTQNLKKHN